MKTIDDNAFKNDHGINGYGNSNISSLTIPDSVTTIGSCAFQNNQILSLTIGNSVTTIGDNAFSVNKISALAIPNSMKTIGKSAFQNNLIDLIFDFRKRADYYWC